MSQATLFGGTTATPAPSHLASLDRAVLRVYLKTINPTWRETGACLDHLRARGRLVLTSDHGTGDATVEWGPGLHACVVYTHASVHVAVAALCRDLLGEAST